MKKKEFSKKINKKIPNSTIKKKETTGLVRVSQEALDIVKLNAVLQKTTMKDYVEELIYKDNERKKEE